jgi:phage gp29-like protein
VNTPLPSLKGLMRSLQGMLGKPIATPESDPQRFFGTLLTLPNPDPILREMGRAEQVYFSIAADPHVLGDIRSIRGNFRSQAYRVDVGDEGDSKSMAAKELCERWLQRNQPNHLADWLEVMWQMSSAFLTGYRPHEVVWSLQDGQYLPQQVIDRPGRRFTFDSHGHPLLISKGNMTGAPIQEPYAFVISRHMADSVNPYGVATLSSCFWPWTFKTGGWRYFVKYCERHGLPWPVGRYPLGTSDKEVDQFEDAVANLVEAGYVVAPEGTGLELLVPNGNGAGGLPQQNLIDLANREMSKALTGQAMVAELQGEGARAASETAMKRQESIDDSVRDIATQSMGQIFRWITLFNLGDGVAPPTLSFHKTDAAGKDRAEAYEIARKAGARPSRSGMLEELGMPQAKDRADELLPDAPPAPAAPAGAAPGGAAAAAGAPVGQGGAGAEASTNPAPEGTRPGSAAGAQARATEAANGTYARLQAVGGFSFARAAGMTEDQAMDLAAQAADAAIEDQMIAPVADMLARYEAEGKTLAEFAADLADMVGAMDDEALREVLDRALAYGMLRGAATQVD